jgi:hypothetical protein
VIVLLIPILIWILLPNSSRNSTRPILADKQRKMRKKRGASSIQMSSCFHAYWPTFGTDLEELTPISFHCRPSI